MRPIPKQYISKDDKDLPEIEAIIIQYDRWVDDLLDRIYDLEEQRDNDKYDFRRD
jgi:hypothetical protein